MAAIIIVIMLVIGYGALFYLLHALYSLAKGKFGQFAPYVPSVGSSKAQMLNWARQKLQSATEQMTVIDLGSGSGSLLIPLAKEFPQHRFIGLEWDSVPLLLAMIKSFRLRNIEWHRQDFMTYSCADADIVFCYILKTMRERVGKKLAREIKSDCMVISELYQVTDLKLIETHRPKLGLGISVFKLRKN